MARLWHYNLFNITLHDFHSLDLKKKDEGEEERPQKANVIGKQVLKTAAAASAASAEAPKKAFRVFKSPAQIIPAEWHPLATLVVLETYAYNGHNVVEAAQ